MRGSGGSRKKKMVCTGFEGRSLFTSFQSASEGMHTAGGVDAELPVPHARGLGKSSQTGSSSVRPNAQQCLWSTRRNNPRELHWPANTPTVRAKYGMKLETDGGCKQGVVMSLKNRDHVLRARYCTALPLLVLAGDWVWPFGPSKLRLTSTSSCCCCPPVVAGPSSLLDDSRGTDIGLVGGFNFLGLSLPYLSPPVHPRPLPW